MAVFTADPHGEHGNDESLRDHGFDESLRDRGHEQVVFCQDQASGLRAIIAIYSTALGPALGGTRFYPYASEAEALADVLDLSRAMAYKNAMAGLDLGGGKAVIWGDPQQIKTEALLRAYGRFVESLNGRYYTACDVGTYSADMDIVAKETRFVTGRSVENGGCGDSSVLTALGVFQGMRAAAEHLWGAPTLAGRRVGIAGVGKVGRWLTDHLIADGAEVVVTDLNPDAVRAVRTTHPRGRLRRGHRDAGRLRHRRVRAVCAGRCAQRRDRAGAEAPRSWPAVRTTSSPTPGSRRCWSTAASCTPPTT